MILTNGQRCFFLCYHIFHLRSTCFLGEVSLQDFRLIMKELLSDNNVVNVNKRPGIDYSVCSMVILISALHYLH